MSGLRDCEEMDTVIVSIIAILISALSLALSAYSVFRDRRRLKSWAYISYEADNKPSLRFMFVNNGRRPIYLKGLCFAYHSGIVFQPFKHPQPKVDESNFLVELPSLLAHTSYIRLDEGEVYETMYKADDWGGAT